MKGTKWETREYQENAINAAVDALNKTGRSLWSIPTGGGKAYCLARLAERFIADNQGNRVLVVIDQGELVRQLRATFTSVLPGIRISVACKGVEKKCDEGAKIIIGTRQTLSTIQLSSWRFGLVMFDEAHELRLEEDGREDLGDGQYFRIINRLIEANSDIKIHGCTATPYRLKDGWIFGKENRDGVNPIFDSMTYTITYRELFESGNLAVPEFHKIDSGLDRRAIEVSSTGDYKTKSASAESCRHVKNALKAYKDVLFGCSHTIAFCVDTEHCSKVHECFSEAGIKSYVYNSKIKDQQDVLAKFRSDGGLLITVDMATKGFDVPQISGMLELRPTTSVAIYMQHLGRTLRVFPGKEKAIIVDLVGNTSVHLENNDLDRPIIHVSLDLGTKEMAEMSERKLKYCGNWPDCKNVMSVSTKICPECGYSFRITEFDGVELGELLVFKHGQKEATGVKIMHPELSFFVIEMKNNKKMLGIKFTSLSGKTRIVNLFFPDSFGFKNGIVFNSKKIFREITGLPAPNSTDLAARIKPLQFECAILSKNSGGHWTITELKATN